MKANGTRHAPIVCAARSVSSAPGADPASRSVDELAQSLKVDFIGIGAPRCGTTWLFYALGQHPRICLSEPKEIRYFNREDFMPAYRKGKDELPFINPRHTKNLAWYARHYKHCPGTSISGEFSPQYLFDDEAPARIHRFFPEVKLLACLRDPIDKIHSAYCLRTLYTRIDNYPTFEEAIDNDPRYLRGGYYAANLKRYLTYFKREQIKVVLLEDIVDTPQQTIRGICEFLDLDPEAELKLDRVPKNSARKSRLVSPEPAMRWVARLLINYDLAALLHRIRSLGLKKMLLDMSTVDCPRAPINPRTRDRLRELFHDDVRELEALLDRDLRAWR